MLTEYEHVQKYFIFNSIQENVQKFSAKSESDDLIAYGLIPEFIGRLPIIVGLTDLGEERLVQVVKLFD